jgi:hypothetical protein
MNSNCAGNAKAAGAVEMNVETKKDILKNCCTGIKNLNFAQSDPLFFIVSATEAGKVIPAEGSVKWEAMICDKCRQNATHVCNDMGDETLRCTECTEKFAAKRKTISSTMWFTKSFAEYR